jgi:hypothetical protein
MVFLIGSKTRGHRESTGFAAIVGAASSEPLFVAFPGASLQMFCRIIISLIALTSVQCLDLLPG